MHCRWDNKNTCSLYLIIYNSIAWARKPNTLLTISCYIAIMYHCLCMCVRVCVYVELYSICEDCSYKFVRNEKHIYVHMRMLFSIFSSRLSDCGSYNPFHFDGAHLKCAYNVEPLHWFSPPVSFISCLCLLTCLLLCD